MGVGLSRFRDEPTSRFFDTLKSAYKESGKPFSTYESP
jgi:hypothetical protein